MSRPFYIHNTHAVWLTVLLSCTALKNPPSAIAQTRTAVPPSPPGATLIVTIQSALRDSLIHLPHQFLVAGSDSLVLDSTRTLARGADYSINYRLGTLRFDNRLIASALSDTLRKTHEVAMFYLYFPFHFQENYFRRKLTIVKDSTGGDTLRIAKPRSAFNVEDIFGPNLQKSGSIFRGFTVGSNRDLTLNSGLRMQLAGKLSSDIEIAASLTDENTPIQPEGTTQTLQEFDKVFVEIKSTDFAATLGDFNLDFTGTEFARLSRKLQGGKGTAEYRVGEVTGSTTVSGAITRGKFATNQYTGLEGVQGPYRLTGRNGERTIIIIAGTERVYINGEQQVRGETNDYTIDYSTGEITFTTRRLVTSASRIVVDFEYTDRQYSRSLLATQTTADYLGNKARFTFSYFREADDPDAPIDLTLSDSSRAILANAGSDRSKAVESGVTQVDSNGYYVRVDTVLPGGAATQFYRYAPGDPNAKYVVTFSSVGAGNGEYIRQQVGVFVWKGPGGGDYLPLRYLPLPQLAQVMDFALDVAPTGDLKIGGEYARSTFNANRFSSLDGVTTAGHAVKFMATYMPRNIRIGGTNIGGFDLQLRERFVNGKFVPIDRTNDIEFNRNWGIDTVTPADEEIREGSLKYLPTTTVTIGGSYGKITRGPELQSTRTEGTLVMKDSSLPVTNYIIENVRSSESLIDNSSSWLRQRGSIEYTVWKATPFVRYEGEKRTINSLSTSLLKPGSFSFSDFQTGVRLRNLGNISLSGEFGWRTDDAFNSGSIIPQAESFTQSYTARLSEWNNFASSLDVTLRKKTFSQPFQELGNTNIKTVLIRNQSRYSPLNRGLESDLFYEVETKQSSKLERIFVRVTQGTGNYMYLGDLNHNGIADDNEFVPTRFDGDYIAVTVPTDQLSPIIDLKTSLRLRLTPSRFLGQPESTWGKALSKLSSETYVRVEEKSTESDLKQIYLLHFNHFQQDSTTITGSMLFTQDLYVFEGQPSFSTRFRFSERRGLNNFAGGIERNYTRERSVRLRWQLVQEISNQIDFINKIDRVASTQPSNRIRDIVSNDLTYDLSYRPEQNVEFGFKFEVARSTDRFQAPALDANLNTQTLRLVYAFQGAGQARVEASREEIGLGRALDTFPYELTGGRVVGKTWIWRLAFDYRVTQFIQATMNYEGRSEGGRSPVHTARAEARAFF